MSITIIGAGIGDTKTLTREAKEKIDKADIIIGAKRVAEPFCCAGKQIFFEYKPNKISEIISENSDKSIAVLMSGDASFFSGAREIISIYPNAEIIAGISSVSYFCSKIGLSYDDMSIVSLHGRHGNIVSEVRRNKKTFALLGENPCLKLCSFGLGGVRVWIGEDLSYPTEKIRTGTAEDFKDDALSPLSVIVMENKTADSRMRIGINDEKFITGGVPMTKSAVRAVTLSKLEISPTDICLDIGAGTGSVSIEMALAAYRGTVYSIEKNPEAAELVRKNALTFKTDNINVIEDASPDVLENLPNVDKVFIGGSSGTLKQTIEKCRCNHIVINAVTLETLSAALNTFRELGYSYEVVQVSAANAKKIADYNMMRAENPVFIITGKKGA